MRTRTSLQLAAVLMLSTGLAQAEDNFTGVWQAFAAESAGPGSGGTNLSTAGKTKIADFNARYPHMVESGSYCVPPGMPATMTTMVSYPIDITHSANRITMIAEMESQYRRVFMDGRAIPDDYPNTRMGYSVGHWEGNTLVIETKLLNEALFGRTPRTEDMTVVERVSKLKRSMVKAANSAVASHKPINDDVLAFELTITDATLYNKPIKTTVYYQHIEDNAMLEYDCISDIWQQALDAANP